MNRHHNMVKEWIRNHRPLFGAYLETHIQPINATRISSALPVGWRFFANWDHHSTARIIVVWHPSVTVIVYHASAQAVTCGIFILSENASFTVTFVYGSNLIQDRQQLWEQLSHINATTPVSRFPWAVIGDCNKILHSSQHSSHLDLDVDIAGMENCNLALQDADLFEAQSKGLVYSWRNCQNENPISKKIDHALINQHWATKFQDSFCEFLDPQQSDHAPGLMRMPSLTRKVVKPFKYFHHISDHPLFLEKVREAWNCAEI